MAALDHDPIDAGLLERLPPGAIARVAGGVQDVALVNHRGTVFALVDLCLRCSRPLSSGTLTAGLLTCPNCGWRYEVERGCVAGLPALRVETYKVCISQGRIRIAPHGSEKAAPSP